MSKEYCNRIYGASDDLLEIDGALIEDEINLIDKPFLIKCEDGTEAKFEYNGEWTYTVIKAGRQFIRVIKSVGDDAEHTDPNSIGCTSYSDVLLIREPIAFIKVNEKYYRPRYNKIKKP